MFLVLCVRLCTRMCFEDEPLENLKAEETEVDCTSGSEQEGPTVKRGIPEFRHGIPNALFVG